jgi:hypothetical protein
MMLGILTLITALSISAVAIYYSVAGLVAIFAAAALPIMIMGGTLEIAKLVTAVWLHRYWKQATWWLRTYLTTAVVVLMLITSMGIFGFLSKAHIEQTAASTESVARAEVIQNEIDRNLGIIGRAENRIRQLENSETGADANIQSQIDKEQERIDNAYDRIQPAIEEQNQIIAGVTQLFQQELDRIDRELATLQGYIDSGDIRKAQGMVGTATDGAYGPKTAAAFTAWQDAKRAERNEWLQKIQDAAQSSTVVAARNEIARLRKSAEDQIAQSNILINRLRGQLGDTQNADDIQKDIDEQNERIRTASSEIEKLTDEKIQVEAEYRKLEAEVGPIKYIAEFIYGDTADTNMLEEAVRWVIIVIIFVFDPLAVLLLIASQYTFEYRRKGDDNGGWLRQYEQARAQRIVDNPGYNPDAPASPKEEEKGVEDVTESTTTANDTDGNLVSEADTAVADASDIAVEQSEIQTNEDTKQAIAREYSTVEEIQELEKKDISSETVESTEPLRLTESQLDELDKTEEWHNAKQAWKADHPELSLKLFKELYLQGKLDRLPWEDYIVKQPKKGYIMKEDNHQVRKLTADSSITADTKTEGYIQNEEQQNERSVWKNIKPRDE